MAQTPLPLNQPTTNKGGFKLTRESSLSEVATAVFVEGVHSAETSSIFRAIKQSFSAREDDVVSHTDLNKQFPDLEVPFNKPTSMTTAKSINEIQRKRRLNQKIIANGDPDSIMVKAISFGVNLTAQALDPIGLASGLLVGGGLTKVMGAIGKAGSLAKLAKASRFSRVGRNVVEGVVGNVLAEAAIIQPVTRSEQRDVDAYESLTNAVMAGVAFPVVLGAAGKSLALLKRGFKGELKMTKATALAENQMQLGNKVDVKSYVDAEAKASLGELRQELDAVTARRDSIDTEISKTVDPIKKTKTVPSEQISELLDFTTFKRNRRGKEGDEIVEELLQTFEDELVDPTQPAKKTENQIFKVLTDLKFEDVVFGSLTDREGKLKSLEILLGDAQVRSFEEFLSPTKEADLIKLQADRDTAGAQVDELTELISEIEKTPELSRAKASAEANSAKEDLYFNQERTDIREEIEQGIEEPKEVTFRKQEFEDTEVALKELEASDELSTLDKAELAKAKELMAQVDDMDKMVKAASDCSIGGS